MTENEIIQQDDIEDIFQRLSIGDFLSQPPY